MTDSRRGYVWIFSSKSEYISGRNDEMKTGHESAGDIRYERSSISLDFDMIRILYECA